MHNSEYKVEKPLTVPNGATLEGAGVMLFNDRGVLVQLLEGTTTITGQHISTATS
jgi:hypothetical protein